MNIDELKEHSKKPFWRTLRRIYQATNCIIVIIMITLVGVLIYHNPYCENIPSLNWNDNALIYDANKICSTDTCDSFNISYLGPINTNAIIVNSLTNETNDILKQNKFKIIINYAPSSNDQNNNTIQSLIDSGADAFSLLDVQIQPDLESTFASIANFIAEYNRNNPNSKKNLFFSSEQVKSFNQSLSQYLTEITQFQLLTNSFNDLDSTILNKANWIVDTTDPLKLILTLFLRGSKILNVDNLHEKNSTYDQLKNITDLKVKFKTLGYGHIETNLNQSLIFLKRYFVGETTPILIINFDAEKTYNLKQVFNLFDLKDKKLDVDYFYSVSGENELSKVKKIKVDNKGDCIPNDLVLPALSSLVISWPYVPPDLKDL